MRRTSNSAAGAGGRGQAWLQPGRTYTVVIAIASGAEQPAPSTADRATAFATEQAPTRGCLSQPQRTRSGSAADLPAECSFPMHAGACQGCRVSRIGTVRASGSRRSLTGEGDGAGSAPTETAVYQRRSTLSRITLDRPTRTQPAAPRNSVAVAMTLGSSSHGQWPAFGITSNSDAGS